MTYKEFLNKLKLLKLSLAEFSNLAAIPKPTVIGWGTTRKNRPEAITPGWVPKFLDMYEENMKLKSTVEILRGTIP